MMSAFLGVVSLLLFFALVSLVTAVAKRRQSTLAVCLAPLVSGTVCATLYMGVCVRLLMVQWAGSVMIGVLTLLALASCALFLMRLRTVHSQADTSGVLRTLRARGAAALALLVAQSVLCSVVLVAFSLSASANTLLLAGLFCVNHLLFLFPLAALLLAFAPVGARSVKAC